MSRLGKTDSMAVVSEQLLEIDESERFAFGENWRRFLDLITPERISAAEESLKSLLQTDDLRGRTFLDIGSGSGLFSLAARRLGARVHSFDYDPKSVGCTNELRKRYCREDPYWVVEQGSVLDIGYLYALGTFDVVYSWGVLHHTGDMWRAIENASKCVRPGGLLSLAIYNDQGGASRRWTAIKRLHLASPRWARKVIEGCCFVRLYGPTILKSALRGRQPALYAQGTRGMSLWRDLVDWVGGYPFEVASAGEIFEFLHGRAFTLVRMTTTHSLGCNEFVFRNGN